VSVQLWLITADAAHRVTRQSKPGVLRLHKPSGVAPGPAIIACLSDRGHVETAVVEVVPPSRGVGRAIQVRRA